MIVIKYDETDAMSLFYGVKQAIFCTHTGCENWLLRKLGFVKSDFAQRNLNVLNVSN